MTTPISALGDQYVRERTKRNPISATYLGVTEDFDGTGDFGPEGQATEAEADRRALAELNGLEPVNRDDRVAAAHMRERLTTNLDAYDSGEWKRSLRAPYGMVQSLRNYLDMGGRTTPEQWELATLRLEGMPGLLEGWIDCLKVGLADGVTAARRQAVAAADQAQGYLDINSFDSIVSEYGDGPLKSRLEAGVAAATSGYAELVRFLREDYAPRATETDGVGAERYEVASRQCLGDVIDAHDAYNWGWEELRRLEAEMAVEAEKVLPGAELGEVIEHLNRTQSVEGEDAYLEWLKELHATALDRLDGTHFDIDPRIKDVDVVLVHAKGAGSPYYTPPSEDLSRLGRTWWPVADRTRFNIWNEATTVYHEGVPGHHLQYGQINVVDMPRYTRNNRVSGNSEGWALYAEKLADELGWHDEPGRRLGMLKASAMRAARVVIDIGVHLDLPIPASEVSRHGPRWNFDVAVEVLRDRGRVSQHRLYPEIVRYFGWPGQAITYKLGERAWLAARDEAKARPGFDLKKWHTDALNLGPVGLGVLTDFLRDL